MTLHGLLEASADRFADRPAIVDGDRSITFRQLDDLARRTATALLDRGVGPGDRVLVVAPRSIEAIAALYGVMKSGAAYVALEPTAPAKHLERVAEECKATGIVHSGRSSGVLGDRIASLDVAEMAELSDSAGELPTVGPDDTAYLIYTSGTTGIPKGVVRTHRNGLAVVDWAVRRFAFGPDDRFAGHTPLHFGPHRFDLYVSCAVGACVFPLGLPNARLAGQTAAHVARHRLTVWWSAASVLQNWCTQGGFDPTALGSLRWIGFGAERLSFAARDRLRALVPDAEIHGFYGSSETGTVASQRMGETEWTPGDPYPLGRPIDILRIAILGDDLTPVVAGAVGELYVSGPGVMPGYFDAPREEGFVELADGRYFRTRDLVALESDGVLRLVGRLDQQVKIRGYRVDPVAVEDLIKGCSEVEDAAVVTFEQRGLKGLAAFVVATGVTERDIRSYVMERSPSYMVPSTVDVLETLPRSSNGKVDRLALAQLAEKRLRRRTR